MSLCHRFRPRVEALEPRRYLSATISPALGELEIDNDHGEEVDEDRAGDSHTDAFQVIDDAPEAFENESEDASETSTASSSNSGSGSISAGPGSIHSGAADSGPGAEDPAIGSDESDAWEPLDNSDDDFIENISGDSWQPSAIGDDHSDDDPVHDNDGGEGTDHSSSAPSTDGGASDGVPAASEGVPGDEASPSAAPSSDSEPVTSPAGLNEGETEVTAEQTPASAGDESADPVVVVAEGSAVGTEPRTRGQSANVPTPSPREPGDGADVAVVGDAEGASMDTEAAQDASGAWDVVLADAAALPENQAADAGGIADSALICLGGPFDLETLDRGMRLFLSGLSPTDAVLERLGAERAWIWHGAISSGAVGLGLALYGWSQGVDGSGRRRLASQRVRGWRPA